jgi:CheY-like chemotaxis protein
MRSPDSAARLRTIERDLHDGAQAQLVAVAMKLGLAKENLGGADGATAEPDVKRALELVDTAHRTGREHGRGHRPARPRGPGAHGGRPDGGRQPARRPHRGHGRATLARLRSGRRRMGMRIVVAEDSAVLRAGPIEILADRGHEVVAAVADAGALCAAVAEHRPDVTIVDVRMPPTHTDEGLRAAVALWRDHPGLGVLVFSQYIETSYAAVPRASATCSRTGWWTWPSSSMR